MKNAIASLVGSLVNRDLDLSYPLGSAEGFADFLKANSLGGGKKPIADLFAGKRDEVAGFYLVPADVPADDAADEVVVVDELVADEPAPRAALADAKPDFSDDAIALAIAEKAAADLLNPPAPATVATAPEAPAAKVKAPKVLKVADARSKVKPVRAGTKIEIGLQLMLKGVSAEVLAASNIGDDVVDFVNRRVTKRGYGVRLADGLIWLVLPAGLTSVTLS